MALPLCALLACLPATSGSHAASKTCSPKTVLLMTPGAAADLSAGTLAAAVLVPGRLAKDGRNPLFTEGAAAWDAYYDNGYPNVLFDPRDRLYKAWYGSSQDVADAHSTEGYRGLLNYRESRDGICWPMPGVGSPGLGIIPFNGSKANNIVNGYAGGVGVTLDESSSACRFKAVGSTGGLKTGTPKDQDCGGNGAIWCSADGKHWDSPLCTNTSYGARWDTHNNLLKPWVGADWVLMSRADTDRRHFVRTESRGAVLNWTDSVAQASFSEQTVALLATAEHQLYTMTVFSAAEAAGRPRYARNASSNLFLGMAMIFNAGGDPSDPGPAADRHATVDCELAMSTDTVHWTRVFPGKPFIPRGQNGTYDDDLLYCGARPFFMNGSHQLYFAANRHFHDNEEETPPWGRHPGGSINLATLARDRWAGYTAGSLRTAGFVLTGREVRVNVEMRGAEAAGSLAATLHYADNQGGPIETAEVVTTGGTDVALHWISSSSSMLPLGLLGKTVFLSFTAEANTVLYSYSIACTTSTAVRMETDAPLPPLLPPLLPPQPASWRYVTSDDFDGIAPGGNWSWVTAPGDGAAGFTAPQNNHADADMAFLTDRAFPAGFNASFAFRWPRTTDPGTSANEIGMATFIFGAASAANYYALDFPGLAHMFGSGNIWAFVSRVSADGIRTVVHSEVLKEVSPAPGTWHTVSIRLTPAYPTDAYPPAQPLAITVAVDGAPLAPLEDGALQRDGSRLDLSELQTGAGFVGFSTNNYDGERAKSRFRSFSIGGDVLLDSWNTTEHGPQAVWGSALPRRPWANIGAHNRSWTEFMVAEAVTAASDSSLLLQAGTWGSPTSYFLRSQDKGRQWVKDDAEIPQDVSAGAMLVPRTALNGSTQRLEFWTLGASGNLSISRSKTEGRTWSPRTHAGDLPIPPEWQAAAKKANATVEMSMAAQPQQLRDQQSSTGRVWLLILLLRWQPAQPAKSIDFENITYT